MSSRIVDHVGADPAFIRRASLSGGSNANMRTDVVTASGLRMILDEPVADGGTGQGPTPMQAVIGALCGCEAVTFHRAASEQDFVYDSLDFETSFTLDIRGLLGDKEVRPHFQSVRVRAVVATDESPERLHAVIQETEARCPVLNLLRDAGVHVAMEWVRDSVA